MVSGRKRREANRHGKDLTTVIQGLSLPARAINRIDVSLNANNSRQTNLAAIKDFVSQLYAEAAPGSLR